MLGSSAWLRRIAQLGKAGTRDHSCSVLFQLGMEALAWQNSQAYQRGLGDQAITLPSATV